MTMRISGKPILKAKILHIDIILIIITNYSALTIYIYKSFPKGMSSTHGAMRILRQPRSYALSMKDMFAI